MEALGATASIIAVLEISAKLVQLCGHYRSAVKNAKSDIERLVVELDRVKVTLEGVRGLLEAPHGERLQISQRLRDGLDGCSIELMALQDRLQEKLNPGGLGKAMNRFGIRAIKWPLENKEVHRIIRNLERFRGQMTSALTIDQTAEVLDIGQSLVLSKLPTAKDAPFDSHANEHEPKCHPETRIDLLKDINLWAEGTNAQSKCIYWLNGMAGTGKSTISRTLAQSFLEKGTLGASFFFKRGERDRGTASLFFTTIAAQLITKEPSLAPHIRAAIDADPSLTGKSLKDQFEKLILKPLENLNGNGTKHLVLVIDALDECERDNDVKVIIRLLSFAKKLSTVFVRAFVTSRPELPIRLGFNDINGEYQDLILHEIPPPIIAHDIQAYLKYMLVVIREDHNRLSHDQAKLPSDWPGATIVQELTHMAVPLFIFAATVCRYICDPAWCDPAGQLTRILKYQSRTQDSEIDKLDSTYLPILDRLIANKGDKEKQRLIEEFRTVVGSIVLLAEPLSLSNLASVLGIPVSMIERRLVTLHSVLQVPPSPNSSTPVRTFHLSFRDFLVDPDKRGKNPFWVDERAAHGNLAVRCLELLHGRLKRNICDLKGPGTLRSEVEPALIDSRLPGDVRYACLYWVYHVKESSTRITEQHPAFIFLKTHFLHWVEALAFLGQVEEVVIMINKLDNIVDPSNGTKVSSFLADAKRLMLNFGSVIDMTPMQAYVSALLFTPTDNLVRKEFTKDIPGWIERGPKIESPSVSIIQTLEIPGESLGSVAFSHDSSQLASAFFAGIGIWNVSTGILQRTLRGVDGDSFESPIFSHDSALLVHMGIGSPLVRIWDAATGIPLQKLYHEHDVQSIALSHNSALLAAGLTNGTVHIWNMSTGAKKHTIKYYPDGSRGQWIKSVAFSHDSKLLAAASSDKLVHMSDTSTGDLRQTLIGSRDPVTFSHDGALFASVCRKPKNVIEIWNTRGFSLQQTLGSHDLNVYKGSRVTSFAFLQKSKFLVSGSSLWPGSPAGPINIWDLSTGTLQRTLDGHTSNVNSLILSRDEKLLAAASNGTVKIWDLMKESRTQSLEGRHKAEVRWVVFSHDSVIFASVSNDQTLKIWNTATHTLQRTVESDAPLEEVVFSHDSKLIAAVLGDSDYSVKIWDTVTGALQQTLKGHDRSIQSIAFSHDSTVLASGSEDCTFRIWDRASGAIKMKTGFLEEIYSVAFSYDSSRLALGTRWDRKVILVDSSTGMVLPLPLALESTHNCVISVAFSRDSRFLAAASGDIIRICDAITGSLRQTLRLDTAIRNLTFDSTGSYLDTEIGRIGPVLGTRVPIGGRQPEDPPRQGYGLSADRQWIIWNECNILWLPSDYRPEFRHKSGRFAPSNSAISKSSPSSELSTGVTIGLGCRSGQVLMMTFSASGPFALP